MTTLEIKGDWNITKGKLKQKCAKVMDDIKVLKAARFSSPRASK